VLMLDEPGAGLSAREIVALRSLITEVAGAGVGVLLIEHNVPLVLELADEVTVLHQGTVIAHGEPSYVGSHPEVVQSFLGRSQATFSASTGEQS
jgi:ABC-type branched-subunit amino acid transport system ATPase component